MLSPVLTRTLVLLACPLLAGACGAAERFDAAAPSPTSGLSQPGQHDPASRWASSASSDVTASTAPAATDSSTVVGAAAGAAAGGGPPRGPEASVGARPVVACGLEGAVTAATAPALEPIVRRSAELFLDSCPDVAFTVDSAGDEDGLALLCAGLVDVAGSTRSPTPAEAGACRQAGIDLVELRYASASLVVATSRDNDETGCLSFVDLYALLGGRSAGFSRWSDAADLASELGLDATRYPDAELVVAGPSPAEPLSGLLRQVVLSDVAGDAGLPDSIRSDLDPSDPDAIVDALAGSQASIGWLPFPTVSSNAGRVRAIPLSQRPGEECVRPTTETIADGTYPASVPLLLHAGLDPDRPDRDLSATRSFVGFMLDDAYRASVTSEARFNGYVPLPPDQLDETVDRWANT